MKKHLRRILLTVLAVIFVASSSMLIKQLVDNNKAQAALDKAKELAGVNDLLNFEFDLGDITSVGTSEADSSSDDTSETDTSSEDSTSGVESGSDTDNSSQTDDESQTAEETTSPPEETEPAESVSIADAMFGINLSALRSVNPDVIGWIFIPGTPISYPLMKSSDNIDYLNKTWEGYYNSAGSIFLDKNCDPTLNDENPIIYGHNMLNSSFFSSLVNYRHEWYRNAYPYIFIVLEDRLLAYEIFSSYETSISSDTYRFSYQGKVHKQECIDFYIAESSWATQSPPTAEDRLITLSTCTNAGGSSTRWIVQGKLINTVFR